MVLYSHQDFFVNQINKHNLIVAEWPIGYGLDFAIETYINKSNIKPAYIGLLSILHNYNVNKKIQFIQLDKIYNYNFDFLIIDYNTHYKKRFNEIIDYCLSRNIRLIIKKNNHYLDLVGYDFYYNDGTMTIEKDRKRKIKNLTK